MSLQMCFFFFLPAIQPTSQLKPVAITLLVLDNVELQKLETGNWRLVAEGDADADGLPNRPTPWYQK